MTVQLYPSIDLRAGRVVRLRQGDYDRETAYELDPVAVAREFCAGGAPWIHVVDLDAARSGVATNRRVIAAMAAALEGRPSIQAGGGVRSLDDAAELADAGVARVVMGSAAVADPSLVEVVARRVPVAVPSTTGRESSPSKDGRRRRRSSWLTVWSAFRRRRHS